MTILETLRAARKKITPRERWTQRQTARTQSRRPCRATSPNAVCWCSAGAVLATTQDREIVSGCQTALEKVSYPWSFQHFNDARTHAEVLRAFDEAIAKLSQPHEEAQEPKA
jgi:hypothetical protein